MPRLVRRRPWLERVQASLNPFDFLLWLSEEIETREWDNQSFANPVGAALNFLLLIARANSGRSRSTRDDVFGDNNDPGWFSWLATFIVYVLTCLSIANAAYTFLRKRHYRLFENSIDVAPGTPNAHRVRVDNSPTSPDPIREVWEVAVWDPIPICLRLFCLFSPGHVLVYWLFLPISPLDPWPSTTVITTIFLAGLLSAQLFFLEINFSQQIKDTALIQKQVLNEYDTKFVHPRLNHPVRDVGTQYATPEPATQREDMNEVITYTPTTILRRGFQTNPNPNYTTLLPQSTPLAVNGQYETPAAAYNRREFSPLRTANAAIRQPQFRQSTSSHLASSSTSTGDGGNLGVYTHANSPLKKATSMYDMKGSRLDPPRNSFQSAQREITEERERQKERSMSPVKKLQDAEKENVRRRTSVPLGFGGKHQSSGIDSQPKKSRSYY